MNIRTYTEQETIFATSRLKLPREVNASMDGWNRLAHMFHAKVTFIPGAERPIRVGPLVNYSQTLTVTIEGDCDDPKCQQLFDAIYSNDPEKREQIKKELHSGKLTDDVGNSTNVEDQSPKKETHNSSDVGNSANAEDHPPTRDTHNSSVPQNRTIAVNSSDTTPLVKRIFMFLEDGEWDRANEYCETVLDLDPENAHAYLGKLMAELRVKKQEDLKDCAEPFDHLNNYLKVVRFGDDKLRSKLDGYIIWIRTRNENTRLESIYKKACADMAAAHTEEQYKEVAKAFDSISQYDNAIQMKETCFDRARICRKDAIYRSAITFAEKDTVFDLNKAIEQFESLGTWKESENWILKCKERIAQIDAENKRYQEKIDSRTKLVKGIVIVGVFVLCAIIAFSIFKKESSMKSQYNDALNLLETGHYTQAAMAFLAMGDYEDAKVQAERILYRHDIWSSISSSENTTVGLKSDGTVVAIGNNDYGQCDVSYWFDIVSVSAGYGHTVGLKSDGTVVATGNNDYRQCDVAGWENIIAISAGKGYTVGLKIDGTVVAVGSNKYNQCNVSSWTNIVAISAGEFHTVGLKADGTCVSVGANNFSQRNVSDWSDIVSISAGMAHTVGLKSDGTVVAVGESDCGIKAVSSWRNVVSISADGLHTIGLCADGTVTVAGYRASQAFRTASSWKNITAVCAGALRMYGLKSDGTIVHIDISQDKLNGVSDWTSMKVPY